MIFNYVIWLISIYYIHKIINENVQKIAVVIIIYKFGLLFDIYRKKLIIIILYNNTYI